MHIDNVYKVEREAKELLRRLTVVVKAYKEKGADKHGYFYVDRSSDVSALRRQSMELTRALAKMRRP